MCSNYTGSWWAHIEGLKTVQLASRNASRKTFHRVLEEMFCYDALKTEVMSNLMFDPFSQYLICILNRLTAFARSESK